MAKKIIEKQKLDKIKLVKAFKETKLKLDDQIKINLSL